MTAVLTRLTLPRTASWAPAALLGGTAVLYLWGLGASGWANAYYSAAAQAGSLSWQALLFGATDPANSITVDKTPAAVWVLGISVRLFGLSSWSVLVPQALMGVGAVWLLYATVRRTAGRTAGLLAGAILALTPVAVLMFRFNNPDALLVLLLVAGAYCVLRATENGSLRWLLVAGACVGFAFLAKTLQAFLVVPAFGLAYLVSAPIRLRRRLGHLAAALGTVVVSGGWWIALVELWPAGSRPYIGGSQANSALELAFGYNGLGRLTGDEVGSVGGGGWGDAGWNRLLTAEMGGQIAWLLPAAVVLLVAAFWVNRTDPALLLWGGWLVVTALVFSYMNGIIHGYYTVALAPAIAAVVAIGATTLWRRRSDPVAAAVLAGAVALTAVEAYLLTPWTWVRILVLVAGLVGAVGLVVTADLPDRVRRGVAVVAITAALAGPATYSVATAATPHTGAIPTAGPGMGNGMSFGGGLLDAALPGAELVSLLQQDNEDYTWAAATVGSNNAAGLQLGSGVPVMALGGFNGTDPSPTLAQFQEYVRNGQIHYFVGDAGMSNTTTGGSDAARQIAEWVAAAYPATTVDGTAVYDLGA